MRLLLDTNVLLDVVFDRPGADASARILDMCEAGIHTGEVAWHTLPTVFYYLEKSRTAQESWEFIENLTTILHVVSTGHAEMRRVFQYGVADFEDSLQVSAAIACGADRIITRNSADFSGSTVPFCAPEEFLAQFHSLD